MSASQSTIMYLNFATGEARAITLEEHARMAMEFQKRCTYKNGICYVDCEPPSDEGTRDA